MSAHKERTDYIGRDPVLWIERLRDVNDGGSFDPDDKLKIECALLRLQEELENRGNGAE